MEKIDIIETKIAILECLLDFKWKWYDVFNPLSAVRLSKHIRSFVHHWDGGLYKKEVN